MEAILSNVVHVIAGSWLGELAVALGFAGEAPAFADMSGWQIAAFVGLLAVLAAACWEAGNDGVDLDSESGADGATD